MTPFSIILLYYLVGFVLGILFLSYDRKVNGTVVTPSDVVAVAVVSIIWPLAAIFALFHLVFFAIPLFVAELINKL